MCSGVGYHCGLALVRRCAVAIANCDAPIDRNCHVEECDSFLFAFHNFHCLAHTRIARLPYRVVKEFKGSVVGGLDPPGNSILGKAVEGVRATNPMLVRVIDKIEAPLINFRAATVMERFRYNPKREHPVRLPPQR